MLLHQGWVVISIDRTDVRI